MKIADSVLNLIGSTPIVRLNKVSREVEATVLAKLEYLNPSGSVKDRIALYMIEAAERAGLLKPGFTVVEPTSGNTGIALSMVTAVKGYRTVVVMPEVMSPERREIVRIYGGGVVLSSAKDFVEGAIKRAEEMGEKPEVFLPNQFVNLANVAAHRETTAKEIWEQTDGKVDSFVAGVGTGGTLIGVAEGLKKRNPHVKIVAVEPAESSVLSGGASGPHRIDGIGDGFIPEIVKNGIHLVDRVIVVRDEEAIEMTRRLIREEGLFVGISSGANVVAAIQVARTLGRDQRVVTILPDNAYRYVSTDLFKW